MPQSFRLATGGRVDRTKPLHFFFDGKTVEGFAGDTVASALLANGVRLVGRSFKYHRPRGIFSHGADEPNALLQVDRGPGREDPNNRATMLEATEGLITHSQNRWPSLDCDFGAINDLLSPLFAAGFYYRTFKWPRSFWEKVYEPVIRTAAGLGICPTMPDADRYLHRYAHCDVLVIGAGPAGLAAALAASENGKRVMVADEQAELGGTLLHETSTTIDGVTANDWLKRAVATLAGRANVIVLPRTTVFGYYNHNHLAMAERVADHKSVPSNKLPRERLWQIRAKEVVLATGAHERPLVFAGNDRPGIMLAESVRAYINRYGVTPGFRIVLVTNGASAYRVALDAKSAGIHVTLVDVRPEGLCGAELSAVRRVGVEVFDSHTVLGSTGRRAVSGLIIAPIGQDGAIGSRRILSCDCVGTSGGWTPTVHLFSQSGGKLDFAPDIDAFVPGIAAQSARSAGAAHGSYDLQICLTQGWQAGQEAAKGGQSRAFSTKPKTWNGFQPVRVLPTDRDSTGAKAFLDFQNDVLAKDIRLAVREGFESVEHVKRYTTTGMATDQGKTSNMIALGLVSEILKKPVAQVGTTTFRPPYTPVTFGTLAGSARGDLYDPIRKTPLHGWAQTHSAVFENVGLWRRAWYFPKAGEDMHAAVTRECRAVRSNVGIFDGSTLGKIEVIGPDAAEFLNRVYVNAWDALAPGRCRYGVMLNEAGYVFDDGVVARLAHDRFHVTTTSAGASGVLSHMEDYLQTEWPELKVFLTSITEQWAVITLQGPNARDVIAPLVSEVNMDAKSFPHMRVRIGRICGVPARLFRVSFTGELGYEINVPSDHALSVWEAIYTRGQALGVTPYGTEAMHVLRAEKGFVIVGQETDGTVTLDDLGLAHMITKTKSDFVGKRSLARPDLMRSGRKQLVGLLTDDPKILLHEGAQVVASPHQSGSAKSLGHVTSSYWSDACGRSIALALIVDGRALTGRALYATAPLGFVQVCVTEPVFHKRAGAPGDA